MAATHAALRHPKYHLSMIRIGLGMFGHGLPRWLIDAKTNQATNCLPARFDDDLDLTGTAQFDAFETVDGHERIAMPAIRLEPVVRWRSRVIHVRRHPAGSTVGYGCTRRLTRDSFLGLVPVGYADGYPLSLSNKGCVQIMSRSSGSGSGSSSSSSSGNGSDAVLFNKAHPLPWVGSPITAPIVGRVNMDQIIVDLTPGQDEGEQAVDSSARSPLAQVGDMVDVISSDPASPCSLPRLAELAQTSCYEMLCRISPRVPRLYLNTAPSPAAVAADRLKLTVV
jgi:alanine racemase